MTSQARTASQSNGGRAGSRAKSRTASSGSSFLTGAARNERLNELSKPRHGSIPAGATHSARNSTQPAAKRKTSNRPNLGAGVGATGRAAREAPEAKQPRKGRTVRVASATSSSAPSTATIYQSDQPGTRDLQRSSTATCDSDDQPSVNVCVRIRPLNASEAAHDQTLSTFCDLDKPGHLQLLRRGSGNSRNGRKSDVFTFDTVLPTSAGQSAVYNLLGSPVVHAVADGYHGCIFAYGQTGSGKSYTIFGGKGDTQGLIHRIAEGLFQELDAHGGEYIVKMSSMEVYNEQARDLLQPIQVASAGESVASKTPPLEVREHPQVGVFVDGLTRSAVDNAADISGLVDFGHKIRVVGSTNMNATSSRSHAIVSLHVERVLDSSADITARRGALGGRALGGQRIRRHAQLHVVDLAGSERMVHAGDNPTRQHESKQINKSLLALGQMIVKLAARGQGASSPAHIPYRDSKLTFLLSQSLMGNCRTAMLACISPCSENVGLTESTLRFAASVKKIRTRPVRNEEIEGDLVRSLRAKIEVLEKRLQDSLMHGSPASDLQIQIRSEQYLQEQHGSTFAEHKAKSKAVDSKRRQTLHLLGLAHEQNGQEHTFYIANVCDDPLLSGRLSWGLLEGDSLTIGSDPSCAVRVDGLGVEPEMCTLRCTEPRRLEVVLRSDLSSRVGRIRSNSTGASSPSRASALRRGSANGNINVTVNGELVQHTKILNSRDLLMVGRTNRFKVLGADAAGEGSHPEDSLALDGTHGQVLAKDFADRLRSRFGQGRADKVLKDLQHLQVLVDEANDFTDELRTEEEYDIVFKEYIMMDPAEGDEAPSLVVAMRRVDRPEEIDAKGPVFTTDGGCHIETLATCTVTDFKHRLEVMHDLYDEVRKRNKPWGQHGDLDPWQVITHIPRFKDDFHSPRSTISLHDVGAGVLPRVMETELSSTSEHRPLSGGPPPPEREEPDAEPGDAERRRDFALILQELARAHASRDSQASELAGVRRELEELRSAIARAPRSPARRPGETPGGGSPIYSSLAGQSPVNLASQVQGTPERAEPPANALQAAVRQSRDLDTVATPEQPSPSPAKPEFRLGPASGSSTPRDKRAQTSPQTTNGLVEGSGAEAVNGCNGAAPNASTSSISPAPIMSGVVAGGKARESSKDEISSSPLIFACGLSSVLQEPPGSEDRRSRTAIPGITRISHASLPESEGAGSFMLARPPEGLFPAGSTSSVRSSPAPGVLRQSSAPARSVQVPSLRPPMMLLPSPRASCLTPPRQQQPSSIAAPIKQDSCSNPSAPDAGPGKPMLVEPVTRAGWTSVPLMTQGALQPAAAAGDSAPVFGRGLPGIPLHVPQLGQQVLQSIQFAQMQPGLLMRQPMQRNSRSSSPVGRATAGHLLLRAPSQCRTSSPPAAMGSLQRSHTAEATMSSRLQPAPLQAPGAGAGQVPGLQHGSGSVTPPAALIAGAGQVPGPGTSLQTGSGSATAPASQLVAATMASRPQHSSGSITPLAPLPIFAAAAGQVPGCGTSMHNGSGSITPPLPVFAAAAGQVPGLGANLQNSSGSITPPAPLPVFAAAAAGQVPGLGTSLQNGSGSATPPSSLQVAAIMSSRLQQSSGSITPPAPLPVFGQVSGCGTIHPVQPEASSYAASAAAVAAQDAAAAIAAAAAQATAEADMSLPSNDMLRPVSPIPEAFAWNLRPPHAQTAIPESTTQQAQALLEGKANATLEDLKFFSEIERRDSSAWKVGVQSELATLQREVESLGEMYKDLSSR